MSILNIRTIINELGVVECYNTLEECQDLIDKAIEDKHEGMLAILFTIEQELLEQVEA